MDEVTTEVTVEPAQVEPVTDTSVLASNTTGFKKVGWEVSKDVVEGKLRIRMKNEQGKIIDKASIDINTPVEEIKQRLQARNYDVSNFKPLI